MQIIRKTKTFLYPARFQDRTQTWDSGFGTSHAPWFGLGCSRAVRGHSPHAGTRQALDGSRVTGSVCLEIKLSNDTFPSWLRKLSKISVPFSSQTFFCNSALLSQALWSLLFLEVDGTKQGCTGFVALWDCQRCPHTWTQLWKDFLTLRSCRTGLASFTGTSWLPLAAHVSPEVTFMPLFLAFWVNLSQFFGDFGEKFCWFLG